MTSLTSRGPVRAALAGVLALLGTLAGACGDGGTTGAGGDTVGQGASGGAGGAGGAPVACGGLDQEACLDAYPTCVPLYDDECCSSCDPGPCSECTSLVYHHCLSKEEACGADPPACGLLPDWACSSS